MLRGNCLGAETIEYHLLFAATRAAEYPLQVDDCSITEARHLYRNRGIKMVLSAISVETGSCRSEPLEALGCTGNPEYVQSLSNAGFDAGRPFSCSWLRLLKLESHPSWLPFS
jgi:hypothetical protein